MPSQVLKCMKQLLRMDSHAMDNTLSREFFFQRLPENAQMVLVTTATTDLQEPAALGDKAVEVAISSPKWLRFHQPRIHLLSALSTLIMCIVSPRLSPEDTAFAIVYSSYAALSPITRAKPVPKCLQHYISFSGPRNRKEGALSCHTKKLHNAAT